MKKIIGYIFELILVVCLVFVIVISISSKTNKTVFNHTFLVVSSGSMEPSIKIGSLIVVRSIQPSQLKKNDVITFKNPKKVNELVTHRINKITTNKKGSYQFTTKGDANNTIDLWEISSKGVVGKTVYVVPKLGSLVDFIKKPKGFIIFVILPAMIIIFSEIKNIINYFEEKWKKKYEKSNNK